MPPTSDGDQPGPHIRLLALGTRGDVQPYVALGLGLQQAGFHVSIGTTSDFTSFVESYGLPCVTTDWNLQAMIKRTAQEVKQTSSNMDKRLSRQQRQNKWEFLRRLRETTLELAEGADMLLYSSAAAFAVPHVAEKLKIPALFAAFQPAFTPTRDFPLTGMPAWPLGGSYNRFTYSFLEWLTWLFLRPATNKWRHETLHLPPFSGSGPFESLRNGPIPVLYGFSPAVQPAPTDWGTHIHVTGYWFLPPQHEWQPPAELASFLESGEPPVYIGFGSMPTPDPQATTEMVLEAVKQAGVRAILVAGWDGLSEVQLPKNVLLLKSAPHDWLLPRVAAAVHHGGAGTTAESLRAGIPTLIVPFSSKADQPFWGRRVAALGVGPEPIPFKRLTTQALATAIRQMVEDTAMHKQATQLGNIIRAEDGVGNAVRVIKNFLQGHYDDA